MAHRGIRIAVSAIAVLVTASAVPSPAQVRQIQGGNALDANPMVGSGGVNYAAPRPPINRANALMTGNVGGGAGFRGYSPIRDTSQFWNNLPSAGLSGFRADGISVGDLLAGQRNYQSRSYYDPSRAVTSSGNVGSVDRRTNPTGIPGARNPYVDPRQPLYSPGRDPVPFQSGVVRQPMGAGMSVEAALERTVNPRLWSSPLFSQSYVPLSQVRRADVSADTTGIRSATLAQPDRTPFEAEPIAPRRPVTPPLDRVFRGGVEQPTAAPGVAQPAEPAAPPAPGETIEVPPEWLGRDLYRDLASAAQAVRDRTLAVSLMTGAPEASGGVDSGVFSRHASWVRDFVSKPMTTFAGTAPTALNSYLTRAENDMRDGKYYRAASLYAMAGDVDPESPLPQIGRSFALAAAGEYMTSVDMLCRGIEKFPAIAYFRIDLKSFVPDERILDSRRAELERLLKQNDDYRLRFLLGYLEYHSGFSIPGLDNLAKAAAGAPGTSPISRFPELLRRGRLAPTTPAAAPAPAKEK